MYYDQDRNGVSRRWIDCMKETISTNAGKYSTARMLVDYSNNLYIPLCNLTKEYYQDLETVTEFNSWKNEIFKNWKDIKIIQENNADNITIDAGNQLEVKCYVELPNIDIDSVKVEVYSGRISTNGVLEKVDITQMNLTEIDEANKRYGFVAKIAFSNGGNYGYTFRVMPKHKMILDSENLNLVKWIDNNDNA